MITRSVLSSTVGFLDQARVPIVLASVLLAAVGLGAVTPSQAQAADSPLTVTHGTVRATTLAGNLNGTEAVLKGNSSAASQTVSGKGHLVLMARGTSCKGRAKVRVYVDNKKVKVISLSAAKKFTKYTVKNYTAVAARTVKVRLINNKGIKHKCNRDAFVAGSYMGGVASPNSAATKLKVVYGDMNITEAGTNVSGIELHGYLSIKADNVTIKDSWLRGGATATATKALVMSWSGAKNLRVIKNAVTQPDGWVTLRFKAGGCPVGSGQRTWEHPAIAKGPKTFRSGPFGRNLRKAWELAPLQAMKFPCPACCPDVGRMFPPEKFGHFRD